MKVPDVGSHAKKNTKGTPLSSVALTCFTEQIQFHDLTRNQQVEDESNFKG